MVLEKFCSHEGHWSIGRSLIGQKAAHFKQEMTRGAKQEVWGRAVMLFHCVFFPSVPIPSLAVARLQDKRGRGEEGERKGNEKVRGGHSGESPPARRLDPQTVNCSELLPTFLKCWLKTMCFIVSKECWTVVTCGRVWIQILLFLRLPVVDRCSEFYCCQCGKHWI